ncbi:phycobiliprotein lyase [Candidatus Cyanaurora vandensis]|uniref:phycobiliprotein lyase n=1 Tax=Candidatus Cyanaurora vandensis TaxID=2714958 RepID=UPI00257EE26B|nr:phycobiliprotein lyase [Candidatus Cyanaurora vandensis]
MSAMEFFEQCAGRWYSRRVSHHLAFRRQEKGHSEITITCLPATEPTVIALCELHQIAPERASGGALVTWRGALQGDNNNHDGRSLMVPVSDAAAGTTGMLLRDLGYAEVVPVAGRYQIEPGNVLMLTTCYNDTESEERFWFTGANVRFRCSSLKRWGGLSMTTFCSEIRLQEEESLEALPQEQQLMDRLGLQETLVPALSQSFSAWGG